MSSILYQTFYMNNKFDDPANIENLAKWMIFHRVSPEPIFTETKRFKPDDSFTIAPHAGVVDMPILQNDENNNHHIDSQTPTLDSSLLNHKHNLYIPNRPNTLFWSLYIAYYGEAAYLAIGNKYGNAEIAEKQKIMEFLKTDKKILKTINKKITIGTTQEIMSDLMINMKTSILSVIAFAAYYKRNILLLNTINKTYIKHMYSTARTPEIGTSVGVRGLSGDGLSSQDKDITTPWIVIQYMDSKKYGVLLGDDIFDISLFIKDNYIHIETYDKPLKGISTYKMNELVEIASKIPEMPKSDNPKTIKSELYGKIWQYCLWI